MAKGKNSPMPMNDLPSETVAPETDYEHSQRFLTDIDRAVWQGNHPPTHPGPHAIVHRMATAERAPHIYKAAK
jgi:hypothetical protein